MFSLLRKVPKNYAEQTYASPSLLVRFAHLQRFQFMEQTIGRHSSRSFVDWGAGDGFLMRRLLDRLPSFRPEYIGLYDPQTEMVEKMQQLLQPEIAAGQVRIYQDEPSMQHDVDDRGLPIDVITCLEVLEHMPQPERVRFYNFCQRNLSATGVAIVEVPVELGPTILIKEFGRVVLKGRAANYRFRELVRVSLGMAESDPVRSDPTNVETWIHPHKGFDYRQLRQEMRQRFDVEAIGATPLRWFPPYMGNQSVVFALRRPSGVSETESSSSVNGHA